MNRRGFLKLFAGAAAGAIILPKVSYFLPPKGGWCQPGCSDHIHLTTVQQFLKSMRDYTDGASGAERNVWYCHPKQYDQAMRILEGQFEAKGSPVRVGDVIIPTAWAPNDGVIRRMNLHEPALATPSDTHPGRWTFPEIEVPIQTLRKMYPPRIPA